MPAAQRGSGWCKDLSSLSEGSLGASGPTAVCPVVPGGFSRYRDVQEDLPALSADALHPNLGGNTDILFALKVLFRPGAIFYFPGCPYYINKECYYGKGISKKLLS